MKKVLTHLSFYVLVAIIAGILLGHYQPGKAIQLDWIARGFINIIKGFTYPIIFLTVSLGIASMGDLKKVGRIGIKSLLYFEVVSTLSLIIGVLVALWLQPGSINKGGVKLEDASKYIKDTHFDLIAIIAQNTNLQILLAAILIGFAINYFPKREKFSAIF